MNKYYLAIINANGLITSKPILCNIQSEYNDNKYWDKDGEWDIDITQPQLQNKGFFISYWSTNQRDVEMFILGAKASQTNMKKLLQITLSNHE